MGPRRRKEKIEFGSIPEVGHVPFVIYHRVNSFIIFFYMAKGLQLYQYK